MSLRSPWTSLSLVLVIVVGVIGTSLALTWLGRASRSEAAATASMPGMDPSMRMSDQAMRQALAEHFKNRPPHAAVTTTPPADSFLVSNYIFNEDGNASTKIDTAHILQGQSVRFKWVNGSHTVTNGTDIYDPNMGVLFDMPMTGTGSTFDYQFDTPGTYPFFCSIHYSLNMKGVVVVTAATPTRTQTWGGVKKAYR